MSYTTTIDTLTRDSRVYVDTQFDKKPASDKPKLSSFTGEDTDGYMNRWITGRVLSINYEASTVLVKLDPPQVEEQDTTEYTAPADEDEVKDEIECKVEQLFLQNPESILAADDITTLSYLHEPALLNNLLIRYKKDLIYTYTGKVLIAINPYKNLAKDMYGKSTIEIYRGAPMSKLSPHVYAMAEEAWSSMMREAKNQSILVSGESGAGKTETTKFLLQYFAAMGHKGSANEKKTSIENQVLLSTPLLEAFGNAKTLRNDNSSRFGKFIEIQFNVSGSISGAYLHTYLLEKSRVTKQTLGERNYHIFYQLCASCSEEEATSLLLDKWPEDFYYLNQSDCIAVEGIDDAETFETTKQAMTVIGITEEEQVSIKRVLAAILHLGNVVFEDIDADSCKIVDDQPLIKACELLQLDAVAITKTFLTRVVVAGRESYTTPLKKEQAESCRDALSMLLYSRMFDWIVKRINDNINNASQSKYTIGVLDIYGFESFEVNSFEQFCINFANEKLQQQYNQHIFKLSQQEYVREKINWSMLQFNDNQICLDLIENSPMCILKILDEECSFPKSTERTFADKLYQNHEKHSSFIKPRFPGTTFTIRHYADNVTYDTTHFLQKNKDYIVPEQVDMLKKCNDNFLKGIFNLQAQAQKPSSASSAKSSFKFVSVASQFRDSLSALMDKINKTYPHYIRCIKPNSQKKSGIFNMELVCQQLKCAGIYESIRITLEGYPTKKLYQEFYERYKIVFPEVMGLQPREACQKLIALMEIEEDKYQFGNTKLFLRSGQIEKIEMQRTNKLANSAIIIQKNVRGMMARKKWRAVRNSAIEIQRAVRTELHMEEYQRLREENASTTIGASILKSFQVTDHADLRASADYIQATICSVFLGDSLLEKKHTIRLALACQSKYRANIKRTAYLEALAETKSMKAIQEQKQQLEHRLNDLQRKITEENDDKQRLEDEKQRLEQEINNAIAERRDVEDMWKRKYQALEEQYAIISGDLEASKKQKKSLESDIEDIESKLSAEVKLRARIEEERAQLEKEKSEVVSDLRSLDQKSKQQVSSLEEQLDELRSQLESSKQEQERERNQRVDLEKRIEGLETKLSETLSTLETTKQNYKNDIDQAESTKNQIVQKYEKERADLLEQMQVAEQKAKQKYSAIELEHEDTKSKLDICKQSLEQEKGLVSQLIAEIETLKRQKRELEVQLEDTSFKMSAESKTRTRIDEERSQLENEKQDLISELRNTEQKYKQQISGMEQEYNDLKSKYDVTRISLEQELQMRISKEHTDKQQMEDEKQRLQREMIERINELKNIEESWRQKYNSVENQNATLQSEIDSLKRQKKDGELQIEELTSKLTSESRSRARVEEERATLEKEKSDVLSDMRTAEGKARQEYNELTVKFEVSQQNYEREKLQNANLETELTKLRDTIRKFEDDHERSLMDSKQADQASRTVIQQMEREKADLLTEMHTAEQKAKQRYANLELEFEEIKLKLDSQKRSFEQEKQVRAEVESQLSLAQTEIETFKRQKRELELQQEELNFKLASEIRYKQRVEEEKQQLEKERSDILSDLRNVEQKSKQQYTQIEEELNDLQSKYDATRRNLEQEQSLRVRAENQYNTINSELDTIQLQKQMLQLQLEEVNFKLSSEARLRTRVEEERADLEREKTEAVNELHAYEQRSKQKYQLLEEEYHSVTKTYEGFRKDFEEQRVQQQTLEKEKAALAKKLAETEKILSEEKNQVENEARQAVESNTSLATQLQKEKEERTRLEKIVASIQEEKLRIKKRKEAELSWEIEKSISAFTGDKQERGERLVVFLLFEMEKEFCNNIVPSCAYVIYHLISYWKQDEEGTMRLLQLVENTMKAAISSSDPNGLVFWFASTAALLQLCSSPEFLSSVPAIASLAVTDPQDYTPDAIRQKISKVLFEEPYITFNMELDMLLTGNDVNNKFAGENFVVRFILMLASIFTKGYSQIVINACDDLGRVLKTNIIDQIYLASQKPFEEVVSSIKHTLQALRNNHIPEIIVTRIMKQLISFIDITLFNEVMVRKDICSFAKGNTIKQNIEQLESEIYNMTGFKEKLNLIRQAIAVLLLDKKSHLMNQQLRQKLVPNLNSSQILKILQMYNPGEFENRVANEVLAFFSKSSPAIVPIFSEFSTILDPLAIEPFKSLEEMISIELDDEMPYISFPLSIKDRLDKMAAEELKKRQRLELQQNDMSRLSLTALSNSQQGSPQTPRSSPGRNNMAGIQSPRATANSSSGAPQPQPNIRKSFSFWRSTNK